MPVRISSHLLQLAMDLKLLQTLDDLWGLLTFAETRVRTGTWETWEFTGLCSRGLAFTWTIDRHYLEPNNFILGLAPPGGSPEMRPAA